MEREGERRRERLTEDDDGVVVVALGAQCRLIPLLFNFSVSLRAMQTSMQVSG